MKKKYIVELASEEREVLWQLISSGPEPARKLTHARILMKADSGSDGPGRKGVDIAGGLEVGPASAEFV